MAEYGYDLAGESVALFGAHEAHAYKTIAGKNEQIEKLTCEMEQIEDFLNFVASRTDDSKRLDLTTKEEQDRVDRLRQNEALHHAFPEGKYCWKGEEITNLNRMLSQHIEGPLQRKITMTTEEIMLEQHDLSKASELFNRGLQRMTGLTERILSNMVRN